MLLRVTHLKEKKKPEEQTLLELTPLGKEGILNILTQLGLML